MHQIQKLKWSSPLAGVSAKSIDAENEDVVRAAPTGNDPTTSEWSTILLITKVRLILEVWRYILMSPWDPRAMTSVGPRALGMGPNIDVIIHWKISRCVPKTQVVTCWWVPFEF